MTRRFAPDGKKGPGLFAYLRSLQGATATGGGMSSPPSSGA